MSHCVTVVFGTRPEAIKLVPVILALRAEKDLVCKVCVTGQHRQMLDQVMEAFGITPDVDLNLMQPNQTLGGLTARAIEALDSYLAEEGPRLVLAQGDTTTVFCAALAAFYLKIPLGHVEAGLRTGNLQSPWPEEANRVLTSRLATLHFAPTENNRENLLREGVPKDRIFLTGNTVIDALYLALERVRKRPPVIPGLPGDSLEFLRSASVVLITGHRRENFGKGFQNICQAIADLAHNFPDTHFIYPVHLNPNVQEPVLRILGSGNSSPDAPRFGSGNVHLIEPLSYLPFVALMDRATLILTDSGGVQEEAPCLGKPVLVMRDTTERPEAVSMGSVKLVGTDRELIVAEAAGLLTDEAVRKGMRREVNPYGDGQAAARICRICREFLQKT
jgi:UDP-N-acetylglucosamine 2-epimerase (non-hydrolysing)